MSAPLVTLVEDALKAGTAVAEEVSQRDREKNTPAMVAGKEAQLTQDQKDAVNATISTGDLATERKDDAE